MEECIIKKDTITLLKNVGAPQYAINAVEALAKPVEVEPAKHGKWIIRDGRVECNKCGSFLGLILLDSDDEFKDIIWRQNYCYYCGAQMDGE